MEEERSTKIMIPAGTWIEIDPDARWERRGTPMIKATFGDRAGYVKDLGNHYWDIRPLLREKISLLCNLFGVDKAILQQPMNILSSKEEGTIEDYVIEQLINLKKQGDAEIDASLRNSIIIQGMARGLAQKLGDLNAENRIARRLVHEKQELKGKEGFRYVDSLARSNPVIKYLHRELNLNDALMLIVIRARRAGMDKMKMLTVMVEKALNELVSIRKEMVANSFGGQFAVDNSFGLYNSSFLTSHLQDNHWTDFANGKIQKLSDRLKKDPPCKFTDTRDIAVKRAQLHDRKMSEKATNGLVTDKMAALMDGKLMQKDKPAVIPEKKTPERGKEQVAGKIEAMLQLLEKADITIARRSDSLMEKDLKKSALLSGNLTKYKSLEAVKTDGPASDTSIEKGISFIPLLEKAEGDRGKYYPLFRTRKDHIYNGKTWKKRQQIPIFGALDYCDEDVHGLLRGGYKEGYYGDVVFVLNKGMIKNKVIYTNKATGRSYTDLRMFLYDMILQDTRNINGDEQKDLDILTDLYLIEEGLPRTIHYVMKNLEVQIYEDVLFHPEYIKEIIFAASVYPEDRETIKKELDKKAASSEGGSWRYREYVSPWETLLDFKKISRDTFKKTLLLLYFYGLSRVEKFVEECIKDGVITTDRKEAFTKASQEMLLSSSAPQVREIIRQFPAAGKTASSTTTTAPAAKRVSTAMPAPSGTAQPVLVDAEGGILPSAAQTFIDAYRKDLVTTHVYLSAREGSIIADSMGIAVDVYEAELPTGYQIRQNLGEGDCLIYALYQARAHELPGNSADVSEEEIQQVRAQLKLALSDEDVLALCGAAVRAAIYQYPEPGLGPEISDLIRRSDREYAFWQTQQPKTEKTSTATSSSLSSASKDRSSHSSPAPAFSVVMGQARTKLQQVALLHQGSHWVMIYKDLPPNA